MFYLVVALAFFVALLLFFLKQVEKNLGFCFEQEKTDTALENH